MRLLFLTETIPFPLDSGGRIKTYNTLRILGQEHEVHCHALVRDERHLRFEQDLSHVCASVSLHLVKRRLASEVRTAVSSTVSGAPFLVRRHFHARILDRLAALNRRQRFDAIYCDHLSMLEYGRRLDLPIVLDAHNVEFEIVRRHAETLARSPARMFAEMEWRRLEGYERRWYPACRLIFAVSDVDAAAIGRFAGRAVPVVQVPISVDLAAIPPRHHIVRDPEVVFVGGMHWPPNADAVAYFIQEIFPAVRHLVPDARLTVVGKGPEAVARRVGSQPAVQFVGHVDDVESYFARSRVMVVPIRSGSGMRVKILDGLARQLPIVTTTIGCEGIAVVSGRHLLIGDTPADFAQLVARALKDDCLADALGRAGRELVSARYDVPAIARGVLGPLRAAFGS